MSFRKQTNQNLCSKSREGSYRVSCGNISKAWYYFTRDYDPPKEGCWDDIGVLNNSAARTEYKQNYEKYMCVHEVGLLQKLEELGPIDGNKSQKIESLRSWINSQLSYMNKILCDSEELDESNISGLRTHLNNVVYFLNQAENINKGLDHKKRRVKELLEEARVKLLYEQKNLPREVEAGADLSTSCQLPSFRTGTTSLTKPTSSRLSKRACPRALSTACAKPFRT